MEKPTPTWIEALCARGYRDAALVALDILEPFGALAAQMLYLSSPAFGIFGWKAAADDLALALETPAGVDSLRASLTASRPAEESRG
jgi:hypothetical protein